MKVLINLIHKNGFGGVPAVAQWVKNVTAVAQVAVEMSVASLAWLSGLKDLALMWLHKGSQLHLGFSPWPRTSIYHRCSH